MPIGAIVHALSVAAEGVIGTLAGDRLTVYLDGRAVFIFRNDEQKIGICEDKHVFG